MTNRKASAFLNAGPHCYSTTLLELIDYSLSPSNLIRSTLHSIVPRDEECHEINFIQIGLISNKNPNLIFDRKGRQSRENKNSESRRNSVVSEMICRNGTHN